MGCSNVLENDIEDKTKAINLENAELHNVINLEEATFIADYMLNKKSTRTLETPEIDYVIRKKGLTRSEKFIPDTLAYIINYPEGGFVIVSADRRVYPILGFSYENKFSFTNEIVYSEFIDNIESYIENADDTIIYDVTEGNFDSCYDFPPKIQISLSQGAPWNKYVIQEHPGCPVGCVAVATALVMSHTQRSLQYHGVTYNFKSLVETIQEGPTYNILQNNNVQPNVVVVPTPENPSYTYAEAVDAMAKILYWIGKDVNMNYKIGGSSASSEKAYNLCYSLGFTVPSGYVTYDIIQITEYLRDNYIIYLRGTNDQNGGHAWVVDGCSFCVDANNEIIDTYLHCDWGWGGTSNGYFSGRVFEVPAGKYEPRNFFAVKRSWDLQWSN